jgi:hypothetical protein
LSVVERAEGGVRADDEHVALGVEEADVGELVERELGARRLRDRRAARPGAVHDGDRPAVGPLREQVVDREEAPGALLVLDDDRGAEPLLQVRGDEPRVAVVPAAGAERDDEADGLPSEE